MLTVQHRVKIAAPASTTIKLANHLAKLAQDLVTNTFPQQNPAAYVVVVVTKTTQHGMTLNAKYAHPTHSLLTTPTMKLTTIRLTTA